MDLSVKQLIPPQARYLNTLALSTESDFIALGRATLRALMYLWLEERGDFSVPLNKLYTLYNSAGERQPILPCLRSPTYVSYGSNVHVFIHDHSLWFQGRVAAVRSVEPGYFTVRCIFDTNIPGGDRQIELPMQLPYLLSGDDASHISQCSRAFQKNWAYGVKPGSTPSTYIALKFAELLYAKKG